MRRLLLTGVGLVLVLYLLPVFYPSETDKTEPQAPTESVTAAATDGLTITVLVNGKAQEMPLETYVEGVTAAEIADDFPVEAIRAQAVAARTYAVYKQSRGRPAEHPDADVCDDYSHCAAYQPDAVKTFSTGYSRIRKAVKDTAGQILTCDVHRLRLCSTASAVRRPSLLPMSGARIFRICKAWSVRAARSTPDTRAR